MAVQVSPHYLKLSDGEYSVTDVWSGDQLAHLTPDRQLTLLVPPMGVRMLRYELLQPSFLLLYSTIHTFNLGLTWSKLSIIRIGVARLGLVILE